MKKRKADADTGCEWELVRETENRQARFCHKMVQPGHIYCPKHVVMFEERYADNKRRMERVRMAKERHRTMRQMLETSPLRVPIQ